MANKVDITINSQGVRDMLKSKEMRKICEEYGEKALRKLGNGYSMNTYEGKNRVNVQVQADGAQAKSDNLKNNTILKAVLSK